MADLAERRKELEEKRKKLEERKKIVQQSRSLEDEELKTEESGFLETKKRELEGKKKQIQARRERLQKKRKQEDLEFQTVENEERQILEQKKLELEEKKRKLEERKKQLAASRSTQAESEYQQSIELMEIKKKEIEERKKQLEARKRILEEKRKQEDQEMKELEEEESRRLEQQRKKLEEKKQRLAQRKQRLEELRKKEDEELKSDNESSTPPSSLGGQSQQSTSLSKISSITDIELRKQELAERRRKLEEERAKIVILQQQEQSFLQKSAEQEQEEEENNQEELEEERISLQAQQRVLEEMKQKEAEEEAKRQEELQQKILQEKLLLEEQKRKEQEEIERNQQELRERRKQLEAKKKELEEKKKSMQVQTEREEQEIMKRKGELDQRRAQLELKKKQTPLETPTEKQSAPQVDQAELEEIQKRKEELQKKKQEIELKKKLLQEQREKEEEQFAQEDLQEIYNKRLELEEKKKQLELRKRRLEELRQQELSAEQERIQKRKEELLEKKKQMEERKRILEEIKAKEELQEESDRQVEQDILRRKQELLERRKKLEEEKVRIETEEHQKEEKERLLIEEKKRELELRRQELEKVKKGKEEEKAKKENLEILKKKAELEWRLRQLEEKKKQVEEQRRLELQRTIAEQEQLDNHKRQLQERRLKTEEKKRALDQLKEKEETEMLIVEQQQIVLEDNEELQRIKMRKQEIEDRKAKLLERKKAIEESRNLEEEEFKASLEQEKELEKRREELRQRRQRLNEKKTSTVGAIEHPSDTSDSENEIENRRKELAARRKALEEKKTKYSQEEALLLQNEKDLNLTSQQLTATQQTLEEKCKAANLPTLTIPSELSKKEQEYLKTLSAEEQIQLTKVSISDKKTKSTGWFWNRKKTESTINKKSNFSSTSTSFSSYQMPSEFSQKELAYLNMLTPEKRVEIESKYLPSGELLEIVPPPVAPIKDDTETETGSEGSEISGQSTPENSISKHSSNISLQFIEGTDEAFHTALLNNNKEMIRGLLQQGTSINCKNKKGQTGLHAVAHDGNLDMLLYLILDVSSLGKEPLDINVQDKLGWTPLHHATYQARTGRFEYLKICEFLLQHSKIKASITTNDKDTALSFFVRVSCSDKGNEYISFYFNVLNLLIEKGVDPNIQNTKGETALHHAAFRGSMEAVQFLLNLPEQSRVLPSVSKTPPSSNEKINSLQALFIRLPNAVSLSHSVPNSRRINPNIKATSGETALHYASKAGHMEIVALLSKAYVDLTVKSEQGTPSKVAFIFNQFSIASYLDEIIKKEENYLSNEMWLHIFKFLSPYTLCIIASVCRQFRRICENDELWKFKCEQSHIFRKASHSWKKIWKEHYLTIKNFKATKTQGIMAEKNKLIKVQAIVKGWICRKYYKKMKKMNMIRNLVVKELVDSERTYVDGLNLIIRHFLTPLRSEKSELISKLDVRSIFSDIEVICSTNRLLLQKLEERFQGWNSSKKIGDIFLFLTDSFKLYSQYVNGYDIAIQTLQECKKQTAFQKWLETKEKSTFQKLTSLLILPVQRLPRYIMLLEQIHKNTWVDHPDYNNLVQASIKVEKIAQEINEKRREAENRFRLLTIEKVLEGGPQLIGVSHRRYITEAEFEEVGSSGDRSKMMLFLFSDSLLLTRPIKKQNAKYKFIDLEKLPNITLSDPNPSSNVIEIANASQVRTLIAPNKATKDRWLLECKKAIKRSKVGFATTEVITLDEEEHEYELVPAQELATNLPLAKRVKVLEAALNSARDQIAELKKNKERLLTSKKNLELMLNDEVRNRKERESNLKTRLTSSGSFFSEDESLPNFSEAEKQWLNQLPPEERKQKLALLSKTGFNTSSSSLVSSSEVTTKERRLSVEKKEKAEKNKSFRKSIFGSTKEKTITRPTTPFMEEGDVAYIDMKVDTSALQNAVRMKKKEEIKKLFEQGRSINAPDLQGQTPLHIACLEGLLDMVQFLVKEKTGGKINLNAQDKQGYTPLYLAISEAARTTKLEYLKICEFLIQQEGIDLNVASNELNTPFTLLMLIKGGDSSFKSLLATVLNLAIEKGANPNLPNKTGETCLHQVVSKGTVDGIRYLLGLKKESSKSSVFRPLVDLNAFTETGETPLHYAIKLGYIDMVNLLAQKFADIYGVIGPQKIFASEWAKKNKQDKVSNFLQDIEKKELITHKLKPKLWLHVFSFLSLESLQAIRLVCKEFRRIAGALKSQSLQIGRLQWRHDELEKVKVRIQGPKVELPKIQLATLKGPETIENLRRTKAMLETQLKESVTQYSKLAEKNKELEYMLSQFQEDKLKKLEEINKRQRLANDNLQQQFVLQVEKIKNQEKLLNQYRTEKLEYQTKYEERVWFLEHKGKEKRDQMKNEYEKEIRNLRTAKNRIEDAYKRLSDHNKEVMDKLRVYAPEVAQDLETKIAPPVPQRPGTKITLEEAQSKVSDALLTTHIKTSNNNALTPPPKSKTPPGTLRSTRTPPPVPTAPKEATPKKTTTNVVLKKTETTVTLKRETLPAELSVPQYYQARVLGEFKGNENLDLHSDIWEAGNKIVVSFDIPGVDLELMDVVITRFSIIISRRIGAFEAQYLMNKYKPIQLQRLDKDKSKDLTLPQLCKSEISLPVPVNPDEKKAFQFNGTVYLTLTKLETAATTLRKNEWSEDPDF